MKTWKLALLIGGLSAVAVFFAGAIAFGAAGNDRGSAPRRDDGRRRKR